MNEELKPVLCGCGGEAHIETVTTHFEQKPRFRIICEKCKISTIWDYFSEAEAITAWNRAMGATSQIIRCKNCKFYTPMNRKLKTGICSLTMHHLGDDGFCSDAEMRGKHE